MPETKRCPSRRHHVDLPMEFVPIQQAIISVNAEYAKLEKGVSLGSELTLLCTLDVRSCGKVCS
jgi:hypothetical protein